MNSKKVGLILMLAITMVSPLTAKSTVKVKINKSEPLTINSFSRIEPTSYEYGLKSYKNYSSMAKDSELTVLEATIYTDNLSESIGRDIASIELVLLNEKNSKIEICRPAMLNASGKILTSNLEIQTWSLKKTNLKIILIFAHNSDAIPVFLRHGTSKEIFLNTDSTILSKVESINIKSARVEEFIKASYDGNIDRVKEFIEIEKIEVDAHPQNGFTALFAACANGQLEVVEYLHKLGADQYSEYYSSRFPSAVSPLLIAILNHHNNVIEYLISNGIDINRKYVPGWTALLYAAQNNDVDLVKYLIEKGSDINAKLTYVNTANTQDIIKIATASKANDVLKYLEEIGYKSN